MFNHLSRFWLSRFRRDEGSRSDEAAEPRLGPEPQPASRRLRERGQSLVEYTILLTWMTLASIAIIRGVGGSVKGAWSTANTDLKQANTVSH